MNPHRIVGERQNVVAPNGINTILQTILVELNMTFQQIVAELQLTHVAQQELAKTVTLKTTRKNSQTQLERPASLSATLDIMGTKPAFRPFARHNR